MFVSWLTEFVVSSFWSSCVDVFGFLLRGMVRLSVLVLMRSLTGDLLDLVAY
jgi:hypothetical protein